MEGFSRERLAVFIKSSAELCCQMLSVGRTAAIAERQHLPPRREHLHEGVAGPRDRLDRRTVRQRRMQPRTRGDSVPALLGQDGARIATPPTPDGR